jgi:uncharacterized protein with FMN-binding domain
MRRVSVTLVATIVGLVLLLQFKIHSTRPTTGGLATLNSTSTGVGSSNPRPSPTTTASARRHRRVAAKTRTITGQTVQTQYGPVEVQIVETGGKLTDIKALQLPSRDSRSVEIAANAVPILRNEALQANSARIDVVSGATYTSDGYAQSLQSALDNA